MHAYTLPARHQQKPQQEGQQQDDRQQGPQRDRQQQRPPAQLSCQAEAQSATPQALPGDQPNGSQAGGHAQGNTPQTGAREPSGALGLAELGGGEEDRAIKRARRAVERAYNDALIGGWAGTGGIGCKEVGRVLYTYWQICW